LTAKQATLRTRTGETMAAVLLVDDDPAVAKLCTRVLRSIDGLEVLYADSGGGALKVASQYPRPIHVLLSDVVMPGAITGLQLAETLTRCRPELRVVLMSGLACELPAGKPEWQFISKPFFPGTLLSTIEEALNRPTALP
jgi:two-component system cell cycle sensor histidine kinase/response regulator CckA